MVQAIINISEKTNRVLNIVKAKYGLKDKSQAIDKFVEEHEEEFLQVRPEYLEKLKKIKRQGYSKTYTSINELRKDLEKE